MAVEETGDDRALYELATAAGRAALERDGWRVDGGSERFTVVAARLGREDLELARVAHVALCYELAEVIESGLWSEAIFTATGARELVERGRTLARLCGELADEEGREAAGRAPVEGTIARVGESGDVVLCRRWGWLVSEKGQHTVASLRAAIERASADQVVAALVEGLERVSESAWRRAGALARDCRAGARECEGLVVELEWIWERSAEREAERLELPEGAAARRRAGGEVLERGEDPVAPARAVGLAKRTARS